MKTVRNQIIYILAGVIAGVLFAGFFPSQSYKYYETYATHYNSDTPTQWQTDVVVRDCDGCVKKLEQPYPYIIGGCFWLLLVLLNPIRDKNTSSPKEENKDL